MTIIARRKTLALFAPVSSTSLLASVAWLLAASGGDSARAARRAADSRG